MKFPFEKLEVWVLAKDLDRDIYAVTRSFPDCERYGIISQITRAAVSVASNIAEGNSRFTGKEQARFVEIAYGSLMEVACQLVICVELGYIEHQQEQRLRCAIEAIARMLNALHTSLNRKML